LLSVVGWSVEGGQAGAALGWSVGGVGDVDGDGYGDLVAGAPFWNDGTDDVGAVFVYSGSPSGPEPSASWSYVGGTPGGEFGLEVSSAGDVNGDGFGDVLAGGPGASRGGGFVFLGSASGLGSSVDWFAECVDQALGSAFGGSADAAGDVNDDGFSDILLGAPSHDGGGTDAGQAYLWLGSASGLASIPAWTQPGTQSGAELGYDVAGAGDLNGDGFGDVVTSAPSWDNNSGDRGRVWVYLGSASGLASSGTACEGLDQAGARYGHSVAGIGDSNGDGYADFAVGAPFLDNGSPDEGGIYAYLGGSGGPDCDADWNAELNQEDAHLGASVSGAGDVNGDGYADFVGGADSWSNGENGEGRALVWLGSATGLGTVEAWSTVGGQAGAALGNSVAGAGDLDGDGYADLVVGARGWDGTAGGDEGWVGLWFGSGAGVAAGAEWTSEGEQAGADFGYSVAFAGDVDGDGFGDLLAGAPYYNNGQSGEGRAFLYLGSASGPAAAPAWTAEGDQAGAHFGHSVASAGDVDGDGFGDLLVGAYGYDDGQSDEGRAFLYLGSASGPAAAPAWTAEGDQGEAFFGVSVSGAGDVDGDGYGDLVVGAFGYDNGQYNEGRAFLYLGSASGPAASPVWTADGDQNLAGFGASVSGAGDVDGDGFGDLIVGASSYDNGQSEEGRVFLYLGSASGPAAAPAWTAEGEQAGAYFGISVAAAGDVDGDGFGDLLVGAHLYDNGQPGEGQAFLYLGSASGPAAAPAWTAEGEQDFAYFGYSVASAGDVDGDGFGDLLVGAFSYTNGQGNEGAAFLYLGGSSDGPTPVPGSPLLQTLQPSSTTPLSPGLRSSSPDSFDLSVLARSPFGRSGVGLVIEAAPLGVPFEPSSSSLVTSTSASFSDSSLLGTPIIQAITSLSPDTAYHFRARILYDPSDAPTQLGSRWYYGIPGEPLGVHVRTACALGTDSDSDGICDPNDPDSDNDGDPNTSDCAPSDPSISTLASELCDAHP
jgi:hypothetical protein